MILTRSNHRRIQKEAKKEIPRSITLILRFGEIDWLIENKQLRKIENMINQKMKWIIYRRCDKIISSEHVKTHLNNKHQIYYSRNSLKSIFFDHKLMSLESLEMFKREMITLKNAINEILIKKDYKYIIYKYCTMIWESMIKHFRNRHEKNLETKQ